MPQAGAALMAALPAIMGSAGTALAAAGPELASLGPAIGSAFTGALPALGSMGSGALSGLEAMGASAMPTLSSLFGGSTVPGLSATVFGPPTSAVSTGMGVGKFLSPLIPSGADLGKTVAGTAAQRMLMPSPPPPQQQLAMPPVAQMNANAQPPPFMLPSDMDIRNALLAHAGLYGYGAGGGRGV